MRWLCHLIDRHFRLKPLETGFGTFSQLKMARFLKAHAFNSDAHPSPFELVNGIPASM